MPEMQVIDVGLDPAVGQPVLVLGELTSPHRVLPIWIGEPEAAAIEIERTHRRASRPLTHQLVGRILAATGGRLELARLTRLLAGQVHAELVFDAGGVVPCRASDAVAIALDQKAPIHASEQLLEEAGLRNAQVVNPGFPDPAPEAGAGTDPRAGTEPAEAGAQAETLEEFRQFLDNVSPEEFGTDPQG